MRIGVLAVQGGVREHIEMLTALGVDVAEVRGPDDLAKLDGLVIPGGESTAIGRAVRGAGLETGLRGFDRPLFGTCAGLNLLATDAEDAAAGQLFLGALDVTVRRNGYGSQARSFEATVRLNAVPSTAAPSTAESPTAPSPITALSTTPPLTTPTSPATSFTGVPFAEMDARSPGGSVGEAAVGVVGDPGFGGVFIRAPRVVRCGPGVEVLAELDGWPVLLRERNVLGAAFHPELTGDSRIHRLFLDLCR